MPEFYEYWPNAETALLEKIVTDLNALGTKPAWMDFTWEEEKNAFRGEYVNRIPSFALSLGDAGDVDNQHGPVPAQENWMFCKIEGWFGERDQAMNFGGMVESFLPYQSADISEFQFVGMERQKTIGGQIVTITSKNQSAEVLAFVVEFTLKAVFNTS